MPKQYKSYLPPEGKYVVIKGKTVFVPKEKACQTNNGK